MTTPTTEINLFYPGKLFCCMHWLTFWCDIGWRERWSSSSPSIPFLTALYSFLSYRNISCQNSLIADWAGKDTCLNDGNAPPYMKLNPTSWMVLTLDECCTRYYGWSYDECMGTSGVSTGLHFSDWDVAGSIKCIASNDEPKYMKNNADAWMYETVEMCKSFWLRVSGETFSSSNLWCHTKYFIVCIAFSSWSSQVAHGILGGATINALRTVVELVKLPSGTLTGKKVFAWKIAWKPMLMSTVEVLPRVMINSLILMSNAAVWSCPGRTVMNAQYREQEQKMLDYFAAEHKGDSRKIIIKSGLRVIVQFKMRLCLLFVEAHG